ncbi:MAG: hypothetical protein G01um101466_243 [Parcubacteria group bacterium Gr01-1014_66]|nr:MAG: hypothetical protein G01um101466_243 [Parcubacteria group bacterium Gr01-1014_66]
MRRIAAMESIRVIKGALLRFIKKELVLHKSPEQIAGILNTLNYEIQISLKM